MEALKRSAKELFGLKLTQAQLQAFENYALELTAWNQHTNLTTILDPRGILIKHFLDSLSCVLAIKSRRNRRRALRVVDVGSGAGFPGLPLAIVHPDIHLTLVDATEKKCVFLRHMVSQLGLPTARVLHHRAENLGRDPEHRERYDWAIARAVAHLPVLVEYLLPITRSGGRCLAQKNETARAEIRDATRALAVLGGEVEEVVPVELPCIVEPRYLIVIKKAAATPEAYPRRAGVPAKRPLL
jgi:16S rRNA (guanine527-N7)-methyltransferase